MLMNLILVLLHSTVNVVARPTRFLEVRSPTMGGPPMLPVGMPLPFAFGFEPPMQQIGGFEQSGPQDIFEPPVPQVPFGLAAMLRELSEPGLPIGGHSEQFSKSFDTRMGEDGKEHDFEIETRCVDGNCTKTEHEVNTAKMSEPALPAADSDFPVDPLDELLGHFFERADGGLAGRPKVHSLRLQLRPDHKFNVARLERSKGDDGSETVHGGLPKGLNGTNLLVEQRGQVVVVRYPANQTVSGNMPVGVEQHIRLSFQPAKKEKAHYDPDTGYFQMNFPRPDEDEFDPKVEIVFGSDDSRTKPPVENRVKQHEAPITARITNGRSSGEGDASKPSVFLEVGDERSDL